MGSLKLQWTVFALGFILASCATYRPQHVDYNTLRTDNIYESNDGLKVNVHPFHPDTADQIFEYGNWFFSHYPPRSLDNVLEKGYQPYFVVLQNTSAKTYFYDVKNQKDFISGKTFHTKTRVKQWKLFGIYSGLSVLLGVIQPEIFVIGFGGYALPNFIYNAGVNGKRRKLIQNFSPDTVTVQPNSADTIVLFSRISQIPLELFLKDSSAKPFPVQIPPAKYMFRFLKKNGVNAIVWREGDSLSTLESKLDLPKGTLADLNDLPNGTLPTVGDTVFIETKRNYALKDYHKVKPGETLWSISQQHSMFLDRLKNLNPGMTDENLAEGNVLKLNPKAK